jgi:hypothetical protein
MRLKTVETLTLTMVVVVTRRVLVGKDGLVPPR